MEDEEISSALESVLRKTHTVRDHRHATEFRR